MTRITPRTCLWPLAASLVVTFCASFALTFVSNHHCYAGTCGEWLFPLQARLHVAVWYCWLAISVAILAIRAFQPSLRNVLRKPLFERKLPLIGKHLGVAGLLLVLWVVLLYGIIVGIWWVRLRDYFTRRGIEGGVFVGNERLAAIALTGHMCDVTMGMAIIPISRHSALGSFFKISVATTLTFHMITAYTLFTLVSIHGLLYVSWLPVFEALSAPLRKIYPVLNPTYLHHETWPGNTSNLGVWRASLIFTGIVSSFIMLLMFITTLPIIRKRHFNVFYFTHLLSIVAVVVICLHASTMFYCVAPGLVMWILDWVMRLFELWSPLDGSIAALGRGWYRLSVPLPRNRLDGCACASPLAHFFIHHSDSSIRELHPFTTATHLATQRSITTQAEGDIQIQFLFRKRGEDTPPNPITTRVKSGFVPSFFALWRRLRRQKSQLQWTNRLASCADAPECRQDTYTGLESSTSRVSWLSGAREAPISLRLEGPYFTIASPANYNTVVCVVAGTGISGALAIAGAFKELERQSATIKESGEIGPSRVPQCAPGGSCGIVAGKGKKGCSMTAGPCRTWTRCVILWSVKEDIYIDLPELEISPTSNLEVRIHLTGNGRDRISVGSELDDILACDGIGGSTSSPSTWVYISGPNKFIEAGEIACKDRQEKGVDWYGARWDI